MNKDINVVINGVQKVVEKRKYSFQDVIVLAFGSYNETQSSYTMVSTRKNDDGEKHSTSYSLGDLIDMKEGMRINVDSTNKS